VCEDGGSTGTLELRAYLFLPLFGVKQILLSQASYSVIWWKTESSEDLLSCALRAAQPAPHVLMPAPSAVLT
jgi:hypothetical protein